MGIGAALFMLKNSQRQAQICWLANAPFAQQKLRAPIYGAMEASRKSFPRVMAA